MKVIDSWTVGDEAEWWSLLQGFGSEICQFFRSKWQIPSYNSIDASLLLPSTFPDQSWDLGHNYELLLSVLCSSQVTYSDFWPAFLFVACSLTPAYSLGYKIRLHTFHPWGTGERTISRATSALLAPTVIRSTTQAFLTCMSDDSRLPPSQCPARAFLFFASCSRVASSQSSQYKGCVGCDDLPDHPWLE